MGYLAKAGGATHSFVFDNRRVFERGLPSAALPSLTCDPRTPCASGSTSALRSRLPYTPEPSSSHSQRLLRSVATESLPAQASTSSLVTYLLVQFSIIHWHISSRTLHLSQPRLFGLTHRVMQMAHRSSKHIAEHLGLAGLNLRKTGYFVLLRDGTRPHSRRCKFE